MPATTHATGGGTAADLACPIGPSIASQGSATTAKNGLALNKRETGGACSDSVDHSGLADDHHRRPLKAPRTETTASIEIVVKGDATSRAPVRTPPLSAPYIFQSSSIENNLFRNSVNGNVHGARGNKPGTQADTAAPAVNSSTFGGGFASSATDPVESVDVRCAEGAQWRSKSLLELHSEVIVKRDGTGCGRVELVKKDICTVVGSSSCSGVEVGCG